MFAWLGAHCWGPAVFAKKLSFFEILGASGVSVPALIKKIAFLYGLDRTSSDGVAFKLETFVRILDVPLRDGDFPLSPCSSAVCSNPSPLGYDA